MKSLAAFLVAALLVPSLQNRVDRTRTTMGPEPDVSSVWTGPVVRAFSLGFSDVLADIYWLRAVQYYGRQRLAGAPDSYADLLPLLETAAVLDPRFEMVYRYGAVFLSEPNPIGAGAPAKGVALLKLGADRNPANWRLREEQGLFTFFYRNDPRGGAEILSTAASIPGAPFWMRALAAQILVNGGELEASLSMWTVIFEQSEPGLIKDNAATMIAVVKNRMVAKRVQEQVQAYQARTGDHGSSLQQLRAAGVVEASVDQAGIPFEFEPNLGLVRLARHSPYWRR